MTWIDGVHERVVLDRHVRSLVSHLAKLPPDRARILDVGAGEARRLSLYPWLASWLFDRDQHFIVRLAVRDDVPRVPDA